MKYRLGLLLTVLGIALLVTSSVGVSTVALERSVTIEVTDSAPVEFDELDPSVTDENGSAVGLINVTNGADTSLTVTAAKGDGNPSAIENIAANEEIDAGETATVTAVASCGDGVEETDVPIDVTVSGDGITIERTIETTPCPD